jgi:DNA polymerase III delta subunit
MIRYFFGEDVYAARRAVGELAGDVPIRWLDREDLDRKPLLSWLDDCSAGLFGRELPVVRDVCGMPKSIQESVVGVVRECADAECVIWDRAVPDKRSVLFKALKDSATEYIFPDVSQLVRWLDEEAVSRGGSFERGAARIMVERLGGDKWLLISELERLLLMDDMVAVSAVRDHVVSADVSENIFEMLDALTGGDVTRAIGAVEAHLQSGSNEQYLLSMLSYQFRTLLAIRADVAQASAVHPFVARKQAFRAQRFTVEWLVGALAKIMATDAAIKMGDVDSRTGLMMLVIGFGATIKR